VLIEFLLSTGLWGVDDASLDGHCDEGSEPLRFDPQRLAT